MNHLVKSSAGRVLLRVLCLLRHPKHSRWHWQGILRELASSTAIGVVAALAAALGAPASASADLLLRDSFGYEPITANGGTRYDAASNAVAIFLTHDLSGLRAEFPNTSNAVWTAPGGHQVQTWGFSASSVLMNPRLVS